MSYTIEDVVNSVDAAAKKYDVPFSVAWADAEIESSGNTYATNSSDTSFGLFQLTKGGELGNLKPVQAYNPTINADTALSEFHDVASADKSVTSDPAVWAADSQRPANYSQYEARFNGVYVPDETPSEAIAAAGNVSETPGSYAKNQLSLVSSAIGEDENSNGSASNAAESEASGIEGFAGGLFSGLESDAARIVLIFICAAMIIFGFYLAFKDTSGGEAAEGVGKVASL